MTSGPKARRGRRSFAVTRQEGRLTVVAEPRPTIAVVGAGFSGSLLALHLLRRCPRARVVLIERNRQFGRGLAYATGNDSHLLNVPAGRMSAFHDRPGDFVDWLRRQQAGGRDGVPFDAGSFVPRRLFGTYVRHLLNSELKGGEAGRLELLRGEVVDIIENGALLLRLDRERAVEAHVAVAALGNFPPAPPPVDDPWIYGSPWYKGDPWGCDTLAALDPEAPVLLIGTGLTMVDTVMSLLDSGHRGPAHALSRRGLLPRCHAPPEGASAPLPSALPPSISALTRLVRQEIARARENGASWQAIIDALRPATQELWLSLPAAERGRFLRHLRPWWDVHRHRLAPEIARRVDLLLRLGRLTVSAGRITAYRETAAGIEVDYRPARGDGIRRLGGIGRIINCAGPACDFDRIRNPLVQHLLQRGQARPDALRLGLDVTLHGALIARDGALSQRLYAVGPPTKGLFWEMTAVPDIRRQCELLATHLAQVVASHRFPRLAHDGRESGSETASIAARRPAAEDARELQ
ncbi:MAG TPA: FAD/NAD(P)-binding protein [Stellaceae bacterium]|nr:FAD/NAD(P)-binding protein [Stellaceae bacterium]